MLIGKTLNERVSLSHKKETGSTNESDAIANNGPTGPLEAENLDLMRHIRLTQRHHITST